MELQFEGVADLFVDEKSENIVVLTSPDVEINALDVLADHAILVLYLFWHQPHKMISTEIRFRFTAMSYNVLESTKELDD